MRPNEETSAPGVRNEEPKEQKKTVPCRYCNLEVEMGVKRCLYCGTHNPSMNVKRAMVWTVTTIAVFYLINFLIQLSQG